MAFVRLSCTATIVSEISNRLVVVVTHSLITTLGTVFTLIQCDTILRFIWSLFQEACHHKVIRECLDPTAQELPSGQTRRSLHKIQTEREVGYYKMGRCDRERSRLLQDGSLWPCSLIKIAFLVSRYILPRRYIEPFNKHRMRCTD